MSAGTPTDGERFDVAYLVLSGIDDGGALSRASARSGITRLLVGHDV